jgi:hypothetical protein
MDQLDKRSKGVQDGSIKVTPKTGKISISSKAVQDGSVTLNKDNTIRANCSAMNKGDLRKKPTLQENANARRAFTEDEKEGAWEKATKICGYERSKYRQDKSGNVLYKASYGKSTPMGWDIDHSKPLVSGGTYHPNNLQILHWYHNRHHKGKNYPYNYTSTQFGKSKSDFIESKLILIKKKTRVILKDYESLHSAAVKNDVVRLTKDKIIYKNNSAA